MIYNVSSATLNSSIPYHTVHLPFQNPATSLSGSSFCVLHLILSEMILNIALYIYMQTSVRMNFYPCLVTTGDWISIPLLPRSIFKVERSKFKV